MCLHLLCCMSLLVNVLGAYSSTTYSQIMFVFNSLQQC
jgi:hypothetical protein